MDLYFPIRRISNAKNNVFLTFDDGPTDFTHQVLDLLRRKGVTATFFLIAERASTSPEIVSRILAEGHAIGDHSSDHQYRHYFNSLKDTMEWLTSSQNILTRITGVKPVAFRSPAGVWTPKLAKALKKMSLRWVHWDTRFFDTQLALTPARIERKLKNIKAGSIILLHDAQKKESQEKFLNGLSYLIEKIREKKLDFKTLNVPATCV